MIIVNHTMPFGHPELKKMAMGIYLHFKDVVFRETYSVEHTRDLCNGRFAPDTAFLFKPASRQEWLPIASRPTYFDIWPDQGQFDPALPYICIGGSSIFGTIDDPLRQGGALLLLIDPIRLIYTGQIDSPHRVRHDRPGT